MMRLATIGVYGFTVDAFLGALREADVRVVLDVRQRRGVRGPEYAWANARRLQDALEEAGIGYRHLRELAPTTEMRRLQYAEDDRRGIARRARIDLSPGYVERYVREVLDRADLDELTGDLPATGRAAFLCVERDPEACHRSLVARRLEERHGADVVHLRPQPV